MTFAQATENFQAADIALSKVMQAYYQLRTDYLAGKVTDGQFKAGQEIYNHFHNKYSEAVTALEDCEEQTVVSDEEPTLF